MYKVLIADDEQIIREGLIQAIPWNNMDLELCAVASNGYEALKMAQELKPDIIISDIRMPYMSGLEMIKELKKLSERTKLIIISGYEEFEYAQEAIRLGVDDYLLKPLDLLNLGNTLMKTTEKLNKETLNKRKLEELTRKVLDHQDYRISHTLAQYIRGIKNKENLSAELPEDMIYGGYWGGVLVRIDRFDQITADLNEEEIFSITQAFEAQMEACNPKNMILLEIDKDLYFCLFREKNQERIKIQIKTFVIRLRSKVMSVSHTTVQSELLEGEIFAIREEFSKAKECLEYAFADGSGQDISSVQILKHQVCKAPNGINMDLFTQAIRTFDIAVVKKEIVLLEEELHAMSHNSYLYTSMLMSYIFGEIRKVLMQQDVSLYDIFPEPMQIYRKIMSKQSLHEMIESLLELLGEICGFMSENTDDHSKLILKTKRYIAGHFQESGLSLTQVASNIGITPAYLSALFKKSEKQSFVNYLTKTRIDYAKELLELGGRKTYEIAFACGYENPRYFSSIFKKLTGISPSEYRRK